MAQVKTLKVRYAQEVSTKLADLAVCVGVIRSIHNEKDSDQLRTLARAAYAEARATYAVGSLKSDPTVRAYRDLYWKLGIDPTKTRPSGEALLRRVLNGNDLPIVSVAVNAYNLASMKTIVPISGFDEDCLAPPFEVRFARNGEAFTGISMTAPMILNDRLLVLADLKQILCIYPYRDSDHSKITMQTRRVMLVAYGASGIAEAKLREAVETALSYIKELAGGEVEAIQVFVQ